MRVDAWGNHDPVLPATGPALGLRRGRDGPPGGGPPGDPRPPALPAPGPAGSAFRSIASAPLTCAGGARFRWAAAGRRLLMTARLRCLRPATVTRAPAGMSRSSARAAALDPGRTGARPVMSSPPPVVAAFLLAAVLVAAVRAVVPFAHGWWLFPTSCWWGASRSGYGGAHGWSARDRRRALWLWNLGTIAVAVASRARLPASWLEASHCSPRWRCSRAPACRRHRPSPPARSPGDGCTCCSSPSLPAAPWLAACSPMRSRGDGLPSQGVRPIRTLQTSGPCSA